MIYATLDHVLESDINEKLQACVHYAKNHTLVDYELGRHEVQDGIFVNIVSYETKERSECFYEAHRAYIDVHLMLQGEEIIDINDIDAMRQEAFKEEEDFLPLFGERKLEVHMCKDDVLICFPHDAHQTAVYIDEPKHIKKAIFKVKI